MHLAKVFITTYDRRCSLDNNTPNKTVHEKLLMLDKS